MASAFTCTRWYVTGVLVVCYLCEVVDFIVGLVWCCSVVCCILSVKKVKRKRSRGGQWAATTPRNGLALFEKPKIRPRAGDVVKRLCCSRLQARNITITRSLLHSMQ